MKEVIKKLSEMPTTVTDDIYTYLYEIDNISDEEDRKKHLIKYTVMYYNLECMTEAMRIKKEFVENYLKDKGYLI